MTTDMRADPAHRSNLPVITIRADPAAIALARLGLMLPATASVSEVIRAALDLAAGAENPDGHVSKGGWRPRRSQRGYVDPATMRVRTT
jgi:hypothetical protein